MDRFLPLVYTPAGHDEPSLAIAASRAGACGVFDAELHDDATRICEGLDRLARYARNPYGLKLGYTLLPSDRLLSSVETGLQWLVLRPEVAASNRRLVSRFRKAGGRVLVEVLRWPPDELQRLEAVDGWVAKGREAGGRVGNHSSFILAQRLLGAQSKPVFVHGGVGMRSAAACFVAGAAGVVLDGQLLLMPESAVAEDLSDALDGYASTGSFRAGSATAREQYQLYCPGGSHVAKAISSQAAELAREHLEAMLRETCRWNMPSVAALPVGDGAIFARAWARRYGTVGRALSALGHRIEEHARAAQSRGAAEADTPPTKRPGTDIFVVQRPVEQITNSPEFAAAVAHGGALPVLSLDEMEPKAVEALLDRAAALLGDRPWGIGLDASVPASVREGQFAVAAERGARLAILAGGSGDDALSLSTPDLPCYYEPSSPRLVGPYLAQGGRHLLFSGNEGAGYVGRFASLSIWDAGVESALDWIDGGGDAGGLRILLAGGIHDARSAAVAASVAAPLIAAGAQVALAIGTAFVLSKEAADTEIVPANFIRQAMKPGETVLLRAPTGRNARVLRTAVSQRWAKEPSAAQPRRRATARDGAAWTRAIRPAVPSRQVDQTKEAAQQAGKARATSAKLLLVGESGMLIAEPRRIEELNRDVTEGACKIPSVETTVSTATRAVEPVREPADVAIVGVGCLLPKAQSARRYWENILDAVDGISEIPADRWDYRLYFNADRSAKDKIYSKWGGFLYDVVFDPMHYGIPPNAIKAIDPLQLISLEVVRQTLMDAGYADQEFARERVSVILGASGGAGDVGAQYAVRAETPRFFGALPEDMADRLPKWTEDSFAGILLNVAAGRAANRFDFGGVNYTVDAACASSLTAIYQAVCELETRRSDMVIAGGIDTVQGPFGYLCFSQTQALSPRGRCSTFDTGADGIVISEGIAMVALKRLADAERDGDRIYAVIKGVGGSSDGRAKSMTAPHPDGQIRALQRAYDHAGYSPASVGLFEAHGTGTVAGDTAELESLTRLLHRYKASPRQSAVGSVKTLIGHTKATAGVAGLIKSALALHHRTLPPHANVSEPNARLREADTPLYLLNRAQPWGAGRGLPRRASVSAFGFGGTNFHVTLEEYRGDFRTSPRQALRDDWPAELLVWTAPDREGLARKVAKLARALERAPETRRRDLAYSLYKAAQSDVGVTVALVLRKDDNLPERLQSLADQLAENQEITVAGAQFAPRPLASEGKLAVLFAGQGSQYPNMLHEIALLFPEIRDALDRADELLADSMERRLGPGARLSHAIYTPGLYSDEDRSRAAQELTRTDVAQPAIGVVEAGTWRLMRRFGLSPHMAAGHSYGEYAALFAAGVFDFDELMRISEARGRAIVEAAGDSDLGTMVAVQAPREEAEAVAANYDDLIVANHNAPTQSILSGSVESAQAAIRELEARGFSARQLPVGAAFHSKFVAPARDRLAKEIARLNLKPLQFDVYSNTTGGVHPGGAGELSRVLTDHLVKPVEFVAEIEAMYSAGARIFVGIGPKNVQPGLVKQILGDRPHAVVRTDDEEGGLKGLLRGLGTLLAHGVRLDLAPLFQGRGCRQLDVDGDRFSQPETPPRHAWVLNGSGARPITAQAPKPLTVDDAVVRPAPNDTIAPSTTYRKTSQQEEASMDKKSPDPPVIAAPSSPDQGNYLVEGDREYVLTTYQETMRQFLQTQESVMLAYLSGRMDRRHSALPRRTLTAIGAPSAALRATVAQPARANTVPAPNATVSAPPVPEATATAEAASKRNDNGSGNGAVGSPPGREPPTSTEAPPASPPSNGDLDKSAVTDLLLGIVEERTGYSRDMLALDRDMEADLGIDSIKRVEIIGALLKAIPSTFFNGGDDPSQALNAEKTLSGVLDWIEKHRAAVEGNNRPFELTGTRDTDADRAPLPRYRIEARSEDSNAVAVESLPDGLYMITEDEAGVAKALAALLTEEGKEAAILPRDLLSRFDELASHVQELRSKARPVRGIVHLAPISARALDGAASAQAWRLETCCNEKSLFRLLQLTSEDIQAGGRILAASALGGRFGRDTPRPNLYAAGGFVGLLKSLHDEWPDTTVKAVDTDFESSAENRAREILHELCLPGGRIEVGYPAGQRTAFHTVPAPLPDAAAGGEGWRPSETSVILITGGARGITPEILRDSLPAGATVVIVGRTPEPGPEPEDTGVLRTRDDLRRHFVEQARAQGHSVTPKDIERKIDQLIRERELRDNLAALQSAGVSVDYRPGDVRDEAQIHAIVDDVYARYGQLDGVIHAAGVIEDRWLTSKEPDSWDRVFDTKADGAFFLSKALRQNSLRFFVFFSSVAGRYGNSGQTDYASANELLNRLACQLYATWGGSVRVVSLNWGPWHQTSHGQGMVSPETQRKFEEKGVSLVSIEAGRRAFWDELERGSCTDVEVVLGGGPWESHETEVGAWRNSTNAEVLSMRAVELPLLADAHHVGGSNGSVRIRFVLDAERDSYLDEHLLDNVSVLPATAALEMIAEAAAVASPELQVLEVRDLRALRGLRVDNGSVELELAVQPGKALTGLGREVEVELCVTGESKVPHYRATVVLGDVLPDPIAFSDHQGAPRESVAVSAHDAYRDWLFHGPRLQLMTGELAMTAIGAVAKVNPTNPADWLDTKDDSTGHWLFDPGLLDTAPQMAMAWARKMRNTSCLPSRLGRVRRFGHAPLRSCRLYFRLVGGADETTVRAEVAYVDDAEQVRLLVEDMQCTATPTLNRLGGGWKGEIRV